MVTRRLCCAAGLLLMVLGLGIVLPGFAQGPPGKREPPIPVTGPHQNLSCSECHGSEMRPAQDPASPLSRKRSPGTCGRCHARQHALYTETSHGRGVASGDTISPTCVGCHDSHAIRPASDPESRTSPTRVVFTCAECHEDPAIVRAANLPYSAVEHYEETYHGIAQTHGITDVATCVSCNGAHDIFPSTDRRSRLHPSNLERTCLHCHSEVRPQMITAVRHTANQLGLGTILGGLRLYFPVAGTALNAVLVSAMGGLVGFLSGLFGVGGGFLLTPLLIFIGIPPAVATATDAAQITAGATSGAISHSRLGNVDYRMGLVIVLGGWSGGYVGVQVVHALRVLGNFDFYLKLVYVLILGFIGMTMFQEGMRTLRHRAAHAEPSPSRLTRCFTRLPLQIEFPKSGLRTSALLPLVAGFMVGVLAAFLGVGGGFIMLPTMIYILGIPTRIAVGTDIFQIVLTRSEERRVGKECRSRWSPYH